MSEAAPDRTLRPLPPGAAARGLCAICRSPMGPGEGTGACPACGSAFHAECWGENGGCALYGCPAAPETVKGEAAELHDSYWGQEDKDCPRCGNRIKVAAIRCRYCGLVFESRDPQSAGEFRAAARTRTRAAQAKTVSVLLLVGGLVPCLAPFTLVAGGIWYAANREGLRALPAGRRVLCQVGLLCALAVTLCLIGVAIFYSNSGG